VTEPPRATVVHPYADFSGPGFVATESRAPVVFLNAGRVSLLSQAAADQRRVVLVTDELCQLSPAFAEVWREAGAGWVVRSAGGLREGFSGRRLDTVGEVFTAAPLYRVDDLDLGYLRPVPFTAVEVSAVVSLRHRPRDTTVLGAPLTRLAELTTGAPPQLWGAHEPAGNPWDRDQLTGFLRELMPGPGLVVASSPAFSATLTAQRTSEGVEEITQVTASLGLPDEAEFERRRAELVGFLGELADTSMPLVGLLLARAGRQDLLVPPLLQAPPTPLALLIGPPAVRSMRIGVDTMVERFDALPVGRPRIPGLLFSLGTLGENTWIRLDEILAAVGTDQVNEALGLSRRHTLSTAGGTIPPNPPATSAAPVDLSVDPSEGVPGAQQP